jgi:hypothetical protein
MMNDPFKLPLSTIPHKTMAVHDTPRSAGGVLLHASVLPLPQWRYKFTATTAAAAAWWQRSSSGGGRVVAAVALAWRW